MQPVLPARVPLHFRCMRSLAPEEAAKALLAILRWFALKSTGLSVSFPGGATHRKIDLKKNENAQSRRFLMP